MNKFNVLISLILFSTFSLFSINYDPTLAQRMLGYDPEIIEKINPQNDTKQSTLYLHGWRENNDRINHDQMDDLLPGNVISFNFRDAVKKTGANPELAKTSFGQTPDVESALFVLKAIAEENKLDRLSIYGYSRGGATLINTLATLNNKEKYQDILNKIGIENQQRTHIINLLQKGSITVVCPTSHTREALIMHAGNERIKALKALEKKSWFQTIKKIPGSPTLGAGLGWLFDQAAGRFANYCFMPLVSLYRPWGPQPINSAQELGGLNLKTLLHFQHNDRTVSNKLDAELARRLTQYNPGHTHVVYGNDNFEEKQKAAIDPLLNGHTGSFKSLVGPLHTFRQLYGLAYQQSYAK